MSSFMELICKIGIFMIAAQAVIHFAPAAKYEKYMRLVVGIIVLLQFLSPINKITDGIDGGLEAEADWSGQLAGMEMELERGLAVEEGSQFSENIISGMEKEIKSRLNSTLDEENYSILKVNVVMNSSDGGNEQYYVQYGDENNDSYENYRLNAIRVYVMAHDDKDVSVDYGRYADKDGSVNYGRYADIDGSVNYGSYADKDGGINYGSYADIDADGKDRGDGTDNSGVVKVEKVHINRIVADEDDVNMDDAWQAAYNERQEDNKQKESGRLRAKFAAVLGVEEKYMEVSIYGWTE